MSSLLRIELQGARDDGCGDPSQINELRNAAFMQMMGDEQQMVIVVPKEDPK